MPLSELQIAGYRSLRDIRLPLGQLNVITGPNGSGKSNLYRALWLVAQVCEGTFAQSICREGGFLSVMWAGPRLSSKPWRMALGFRLDDLNFLMNCGFPIPNPPGQRPPSLFSYDPEIKEEAVWIGKTRKPSTTLLERSAGITWMRDEANRKVEYPLILTENESVLSQLREPHRFPELFLIRDAVRGWRFYHGFRTDENAPMRSAQVSVRTPVLGHDGRDLAGALQTILEIGDAGILHDTIAAALPGRSLLILPNEPIVQTKSPKCAELIVALETDGCARPLLAQELSDGTLKFLCLTAALLSPRPPELIALNEPESSLHPDLLDPLAQLIVRAAEKSQVWVSTHSQALVAGICSRAGIEPIQLQLHNGETQLV